MRKSKRTLWSLGALVVLALVTVLTMATAGGAVTRSLTLSTGTKFYVPNPRPEALKQRAALLAQHDKAAAALLTAMLSKGHAVWFTGGSPKQVKQDVHVTMDKAAEQGAVPVLVAYDIPGRDCSQYSKGGALNLADYEAWIDGFAKGIGGGKALVILEPDGLGLLPSNCGFDPGVFSDADRYAELNYAVDKLAEAGDVNVYLDATHNDWMNVGDITQRLLTAGVQDARGFFLGVSNYQYSPNLVEYGTWISDCIAHVGAHPGDFGGCPNQYWNGGPATGWAGTAMTSYLPWSNEPYSGNSADLVWNTVGIDSRWALVLGTTQPTTHFVIDSSRNGRGPWDAVAAGYASKGVAQDWCNAPNRGVGIAPTANTGNSLVDAYLWVKVPGESDGQCTRGTAGPTDPEWGITDPVAGAWFPQMALQLAQNASPALLP